MKKAVIYYVNNDNGTVTFMSWKNVAKSNELPRDYKKLPTWFCESEDGSAIELWSYKEDYPVFLIRSGTTVTKERATFFLMKMKALGETLSSINKSDKKVESFEV
jgi:hypothetical protein